MSVDVSFVAKGAHVSSEKGSGKMAMEINQKRGLLKQASLCQYWSDLIAVNGQEVE